MIQKPGLSADQTVRRILVIRGGGLGDFILILPVLAALRHHWPQAALELLCNPEMGMLAKNSQYADVIRSIHCAEIATLFSRPETQKRSTMKHYLEGLDLVISFQRDPSAHLEENLRASVPLTLFVPPPAENSVHAAWQFLSSLQVLGIYSEDYVPRLNVLPLDQAALPSLFREPAVVPIAVHPGSGNRKKNWSVRGFSETILWLKNELGFEPVLITGEADAEPRQRLREELGDEFPIEFHQLPLQRLAAILKSCRLYIGNDSGVSHLVAALGTPVLAFFGPTSAAVWRPLGERVRTLKFSDAEPGRVRREIRRLL